MKNIAIACIAVIAMTVFFAFLPAVYAQVESTSTVMTIAVDGEEIAYTRAEEFDIDTNGQIDNLVYYRDEVMVLKTYDTSGDGIADVWFVYDDTGAVTRQILDTDADSNFDYILTFDVANNFLGMEHLTMPPHETEIADTVCDVPAAAQTQNPTMRWVFASILIVLTIIVLWRIRS